MTDLAAWLLEQIDADEKVATDATDPMDPGYVWHVADDAAAAADAVHMVRWQPARVLAECKAKRLLVEEFEMSGDYLKILASVYADRPGYDENWRL